ncbi:hypothetical protein PMI01_01125 [Caulobacter sp. AP07]|jgi:hypothetical protein|uniref:putative signal transducing protein n=1 Tax=Caulobacter sp. AP07 TaxID=1144304 RepID=UPI000271E371|nr:DUF2007 domain-containing protein [Caulobacter sp. AP07]EJL36054.1 hypothetical protein PMI01_01125 [Caulobacter sp. AP07]
MSLTEIARFADLTEAQIAASRLRAEGVSVLLQNEYWGTSDFIMSIAMGGFRLWTPASEAEEARLLIAELRGAAAPPLDPEDDAPAAPPDAPAAQVARTGVALFLAMTFGGVAGFLVAGPRRARGGHHAVLAGVAMALATLCGVVGLLLVGAWLSVGLR